MHGSGGENWKQRRHMWPVHSNSTTVAADLSVPDFFLKDGRKIHVGDCALFKPPKDSPPFIGIIRRLKSDEEGNFNLVVNWLYRPADIKLAKGILSDAAPNEVFYSFHKDEIPAASLLHPCKVAFLCKGVELPSGISSFVCRRVYDTDHKCLWWLTDKDYINERQEEVDQLLDKTRQEMHGAVQSGGRSPKPMNVPTSAPQSKSGSDNIQNSSSFPSHLKVNKKRDRVDQLGSEPAKRERLSKAGDGESGQFRSENMLKSEIAKITDKGGLVDFEGVEKLVKLMQPDSAEKKIDLAGRIMLVDVISVTDRFDCRGWFLQQGGLPVLDEWLQEVHKGKIGDGSGLKEGDKSVEEFLLALLRALDKLPVNLNALQTCNVGKSVNNLRSHKNSEIQRKARSLVDTWKKRVEDEMNINDAKSGSSPGVTWQSKSVSSEVSHVGNRKVGGTAELVKSSSAQTSISKNPQSKPEVVPKSPSSLGSGKITTTGITSRDQNFRMLVGSGTSDLPLTQIKEEKSSSSSQSHNNSQSSDHAKTLASCREDARSSTAGSGSVNRVSNSGSRHRKSNGLHGTTVSGVLKETGSGKVNASNRNLSSEKVSTDSHEKLPDVSHEKLPDVPHEKLPDVPHVDHGNSRLIVRLPNTAGSPATGSTLGSSEDPTVCGGASSLENPDNEEKKLKGRNDILRANVACDAISYPCPLKDELAGSEQSSDLSGGIEVGRTGEDDETPKEAPKTTASSSGIISRSRKSYEASLSSINALIESCVKFSETSASPSPGDDVGMNLLASVATGEIPKSSNASPVASPGGNSPTAEESILDDNGRLKQLCEEVTETKCESDVEAPGASPEQAHTDNLLPAGNESKYSVSHNSSVDKEGPAFSFAETKGESSAQPNSTSSVLAHDTSPAVPSSYVGKEGKTKAEGADQFIFPSDLRNSEFNKLKHGTISDSKLKVTPLHENMKVDVNRRTTENRMEVESEPTAASPKIEKGNGKSPWLNSEVVIEDRAYKEPSNGTVTEQKPPFVPEVPQETMEVKIEDAEVLSGSVNPLDMESKGGKAEDVKSGSHVEQRESEKVDLGSVVSDKKGDSPVDSLERKDAVGQEQTEKFSASKSGVIKSEGSEERQVSNLNAPVFTSGSDTAIKLDFDLNEGIPIDDGTQEELVKLADAGNSPQTQLPGPLPFSILMSGSSHASITVASAAKGPVIPPENLLWTKGELGWKGSAATSAFRRAEPRKHLEMSFNSIEAHITDSPARKRGAHPPLDIDLNVPDQRVLDESKPGDYSAGGHDFDLNRVDENPDIGPLSMSNDRLEIPLLPIRSSSSGGLSSGRVSVSRDFDLNNGPCLDDMGIEATPRNQQSKNSVPFPSPIPGVRVNSAEFGNFSSWLYPGNSYSAITAVPSILPGRGEQSYVAAAGSQRVLNPPTGNASFAAELYRGPVLSSSPAVAFPPANPFQYPGFPFETSFPLASNAFSGSYMDSSSGTALCLPTIPSQLVGPAGVVSTTPYPRPYIMSLQGGSSNVRPDSRKWGSQGLDLNSGPSALRQISVPSTQALVDEQLKMFQVGGVLKRKEPDSGLDPAERFIYKQQSWQ